MNYYNLEKYAEKININRLSKQDQFYGYSGARFELVTYGSNYFFNTKMHIDALMFSFRYSEGAGNYAELRKQAATLKKYMARYGFAIHYEYNNLYEFGFAVMPADDKRQLDIIGVFERHCLKECEILMHNYHLCGIYNTLHAQLENTLKETMIRYERAYLEYIEKYNKENNFYKLHFVA